MKIGGVSITLILGLINMALLTVQLSSGLRIIKLKPGLHKKFGITLVFTAAVHGILGLLSSL